MKKIIFLLLTITTIFLTTFLIYAETIEETTEATTTEPQVIQLTDYRYCSIGNLRNLINGYRYMATDINVYNSLEGPILGRYNSIIKPDGTLLDYMNYTAKCYIGSFYERGEFNYYEYPQNEAGNRFILYKRDPENIYSYDDYGVLLDDNGNELISCDEERDIFCFLTSEYVYGYYFGVSDFDKRQIFRSLDGKLIFDSVEFMPENYKKAKNLRIFISEDRSRLLAKYEYIANDDMTHIKYIFFDENGNVLNQGDLFETPFNDKFLRKDLCGYKEDNSIDYYVYQDTDGMLYEFIYYGSSGENEYGFFENDFDYDNVPFGKRYNFDFLKINGLTPRTKTEKDLSYFYKSIKVDDSGFGDTYYALFKTLEDGETAEDYIPKEQPSAWAKDSIDKATEAGLIYNNSKCFYKSPVTREDFCILAVEAYCNSLNMGIDEYVKANNIELDHFKFADTNNRYILLAEYLGIVNGKSVRGFHPTDFVTRQEAAVMLTNLAKLMGITSNSPKVNFIDSQYYADWAKDAIYTVSSIKNDEGIAIMTGTEPDKFSPWMYYTREQAYVTIYRLFEMCK